MRQSRYAILLVFFVNFFSLFQISAAAININNGWQYRAGFEKDWLINIEKGSHWKKIDLPAVFSSLDAFSNGYRGHITVRRILTENELMQLDTTKTLGFYPGLVSDVVTIYLNGKKIAQSGSEIPYQSGMYKTLVAPIDLGSLRPDGTNVIHIVLYSNGNGHPADIDGPDIVIKPIDYIYNSFLEKDIYRFLFIGIYLFIGFYHLFLYMIRKTDNYNLYFGAFVVFFGLLSIYYTNSRDLIFGNHIYLRLYTQHFLLYSTIPSLMMFVYTFLFNRKSKVAIIYSIVFFVFLFAEIFGPYSVQDTTLLLWYASAIPMMLYITGVITYHAFLKKNRSAVFLFLGIIFLTLTVIRDIAIEFNLIQSFRLTDYILLLLIIGVSMLLAIRYKLTLEKVEVLNNELETLNENLEQKVLTRTEKIKKSLDAVKRIKKKQDADYFLTSLLTDPLKVNTASGEKVNVEFYIEEMKKFHYYKWKKEIGGDFCFADSITLQNKKYTFFVNADAMGKSLQGAGGILVLGSILKSAIARNQTSKDDQAVASDEWMRRLIIQLQNVFEGFDGSMLVSMIMGLINEQTYSLLLFNGGHPQTILYRDGIPQFIEENVSFQKMIGSIDNIQNKLIIEEIALKPGDVLIGGSDGRDDYITSYDSENYPIINEDKTKILKLVHQSKGNLRPLVGLIKNEGSATDDLSLIRIQIDH